MKISEIISFLESKANPFLQEDYDNAGLIVGDADRECTGIVCSLDATEPVILEAKDKKANLVIAHHPIIFRGLKKINGKNYVEKAIITAIRNDIAVYAVHTNLDNVIDGVNGRIATLLSLQNVTVLSPKQAILKKLYTFVPADHADSVRNAIFSAGGGGIGNYSECSFNAEGFGTFKAGEHTDPYVGTTGKLHQEKEVKIEVIFPVYMENNIIIALKDAHPYEEPAYDIISLENSFSKVGSGIIGDLAEPVKPKEFLASLKKRFNTPFIRHTKLPDKPIKKVAACGGSGSFLISRALSAGADIYITSDVKYHEFFDANDKIIIVDIGHYESEQFTINLLKEILEEKFPTFAVLKTEINTNPVHYF